MKRPDEVVVGDTTLDKIIENHNHWLKEDCENWKSMRANLSNAILDDADLQNVDLSYANLQNASLIRANLSFANLHHADLNGSNITCAGLLDANLHCANLDNVNLSYTSLKGADLSYADISDAKLIHAILTNTNLAYADLINADLCHAYLGNANLEHANLCNANLEYASMRCTNFYNAYLDNTNMEHCIIDIVNFNGAYTLNMHKAMNVPYIPMTCPSDGEFIGWKKVKWYLVKLKIPASAKRSSSASFKCRASKAKVLGIYTLDGKKAECKFVTSDFDGHHLKYTVGEYVYPDSFDENRWNECSHGIHFFINKQDAINY